MKRTRSYPTPELPPLFTIGHSTRTIPEFVEILRGGKVELVVDVRSVPRSRTNPQYNFDIVGEELRQWQIGYERIAELGGLRRRSSEVAPEVNGFWDNRGFHNYADYALSEEFGHGLDRLMFIARGRTVAIMCAEALWWRCHRRIIADYLLLHGRNVLHLMGRGRIEQARMTPGAKDLDGKLVYPAASLSCLSDS